MYMAVFGAAVEVFVSHQSLYGKYFQREIEYLITASVFYFSQKTNVILNVFDYVYKH